MTSYKCDPDRRRGTSFNAMEPTFGVFVVVLLLLLTIGPTTSVAVTYDCYTANETCYQQTDPTCRNYMTVLYRVCGMRVDVCASNSNRFCRSILKTTRTRTVYNNCNCPSNSPSYHQCDTIWRLINKHPCENSQLVKPPVEQTSVSKPLAKEEDIFGENLPELNPPTNPKIDCLEVQRRCMRDNSCQTLVSEFERDCAAKQCSQNSDLCLHAYEKVRGYNMFTCSCRGSPEVGRCRKFRATFIKNKCLTFLENQATRGGNGANGGGGGGGGGGAPVGPSPRSSEPDARSDPIDRSAVSQHRRWPRKNCHNVLRKCIARPACLQYLLTLTKNCSPASWLNTRTSDFCAPTGPCMASLRTFHDNVDVNVTHEALSCDCADGDAVCRHARNILRPRCAFLKPTQSCSALHVACSKDSICDGRYLAFEANCKARTNCQDHDRLRCLRGLSQLMGTVMTWRCSCSWDLLSREVESQQSRQLSHLSSEQRESEIMRRVRTLGRSCQLIRDLQREPGCLKDEFRVRLAPTRKARYFNDKQVICKLREMYPSVYSRTVRVDNNMSCSELCDCGTHNRLPSCRLIEDDCRSMRLKERSRRCQEWLADSRSINRRRHCTCVPGERHALCLTRHQVLSHFRGPGVYVSLLYSQRERALLEDAMRQSFDLRRVGDLLDRLLDVMTNSRDWQCRLNLVRDSGDIATFRLTYVNPAGCSARLRLLELLVNGEFPALRHQPLLSVVRKVLVSTLPSARDSYLLAVVAKDGKDGRGSRRATTDSPQNAAPSIVGGSAQWILAVLAWLCRAGRLLAQPGVG